MACLTRRFGFARSGHKIWESFSNSPLKKWGVCHFWVPCSFFLWEISVDKGIGLVGQACLLELNFILFLDFKTQTAGGSICQAEAETQANVQR